MKTTISILVVILFGAPVMAQTGPTLVQCKYETIATLWDGPNLALSKETGSVNCGDTVTLMSPIGQMTRIHTQDGREAYISGRFVGWIDPEIAKEQKATDKGKEKKQDVHVGKNQKLALQHPAWSNEIIMAVAKHQIVIGMDVEMLKASIGPFYDFNQTVTEGHQFTQLVYKIGTGVAWIDGGSRYFSGYVYLKDGWVVSYQFSSSPTYTY